MPDQRTTCECSRVPLTVRCHSTDGSSNPRVGADAWTICCGPETFIESIPGVELCESAGVLAAPSSLDWLELPFGAGSCALLRRCVARTPDVVVYCAAPLHASCTSLFSYCDAGGCNHNGRSCALFRPSHKHRLKKFSFRITNFAVPAHGRAAGVMLVFLQE